MWSMKTVEVPASDVRLSKRATTALADRKPVTVTRYGRRAHVVLSADQFALVEPLLELLDEGVSVPAEILMTKDDLELERLLAEDREPTPGEEALIEELLVEAPAS
jgi:PHD/YefM family antitoxin component YafN of YafNO toxin-antitoxin module